MTEKYIVVGGKMWSAKPIYILCECVECGWQDQFRQDLISNKQVDVHCDRCDGERTFNSIAKTPNDKAEQQASENEATK